MTRKLGSGRLIIASHNEDKVREITALLHPHGVEPVSAAMLGLPEPKETGTTFAENATLKALVSARASGLPALADDSGLEVRALGGRPGVYTADWAERQWFEGAAGRDWYMAMGKVEGLLAQQGKYVDRSAAFVCTLCLAWPDGETAVFEGRAEGTLVWPPRGVACLGYDPVFQLGGTNHTFAEMPPAKRDALSHRTRAFQALVASSF